MEVGEEVYGKQTRRAKALWRRFVGRLALINNLCLAHDDDDIASYIPLYTNLSRGSCGIQLVPLGISYNSRRADDTEGIQGLNNMQHLVPSSEQIKRQNWQGQAEPGWQNQGWILWDCWE